MDAIADISKRDIEITKVFNGCMDVLEKLMTDSEVRKTSGVLYQFVTKLDRINRGIIHLCFEGNLYAASILFRSQIEHYLRAKYILLKHSLDQTDDIGEHYLEHLTAFEKGEAKKAWKKIIELTKADENHESFEVFRAMAEDTSRHSEAEIRKTEESFRYKRLVVSLLDAMSKKSEKPDAFLLNVLIQYSKLSSYVHGGPMSDLFIIQYKQKGKTESELRRLASLSTLMSGSLKMFIVGVYGGYDAKLREAFTQMMPMVMTGLDTP